LQEAATRFKIPRENLGRWQKEERAGNYLEASAMSRRLTGGGKGRRWVDMELKLYQNLQQRRAEGKVVDRSWLQHNAKQLHGETYPDKGVSESRFSD